MIDLFQPFILFLFLKNELAYLLAFEIEVSIHSNIDMRIPNTLYHEPIWLAQLARQGIADLRVAASRIGWDKIMRTCDKMSDIMSISVIQRPLMIRTSFGNFQIVGAGLCERVIDTSWVVNVLHLWILLVTFCANSKIYMNVFCYLSNTNTLLLFNYELYNETHFTHGCLRHGCEAGKCLVKRVLVELSFYA